MNDDRSASLLKSEPGRRRGVDFQRHEYISKHTNRADLEELEERSTCGVLLPTSGEEIGESESYTCGQTLLMLTAT